MSAACDHCYAETLSRRYGWAAWGAGEGRSRTSPSNWRKPRAWDRAAEVAGVRRRVFCASLADVFDAEVSDLWRHDLMQLIRGCPNLDWLLLTKRPQVAKKWWDGQSMPENIWLGTTVEDQKMADLRIPVLLSLPARVRFLSIEPMLGPVQLPGRSYAPGEQDYGLHWIIAGGESGAGARPLDLNWVYSLVGQCHFNGARFFMKQLGGVRYKRDRLEDFPAPLRIREFPRSAA